MRNRLTNFKSYKRNNPSLVVGMLGCMAERLKDKLLEQEKLVDLVVGPDAYRDLPNLIQKVEGVKSQLTFSFLVKRLTLRLAQFVLTILELRLS